MSGPELLSPENAADPRKIIIRMEKKLFLVLQISRRKSLICIFDIIAIVSVACGRPS
jgi:hypothetical protein